MFFDGLPVATRLSGPVLTLPLETFRRQKLVLVFVLIGGSGLVQSNEQESLGAASNENLLRSMQPKTQWSTAPACRRLLAC